MKLFEEGDKCGEHFETR